MYCPGQNGMKYKHKQDIQNALRKGWKEYIVLKCERIYCIWCEFGWMMAHCGGEYIVCFSCSIKII